MDCIAYPSKIVGKIIIVELYPKTHQDGGLHNLDMNDQSFQLNYGPNKEWIL